MHVVWRFGAAALAAMVVSTGSAGAQSPVPYSRDRSVIVETSPVDPSPIERHYWGDLPPCDDGWALARINWFFQQTELGFWASPLRIDGYDQIREVAFRPWGWGKIPRRYCSAKALVSDGKVRTVDYSIIEGGGFAGFGTGVEWCVHGLDRQWVYQPNCRMARP